MNSLFNKGSYNPINEEFLVEGHKVLEEVAAVQEKWGKGDTDTFINELRDSIAGYCLGLDLVNTEKHGFDCKKGEKEDVFLEVKSASYDASTWGATFNDTTIEKAQCFKSDKLYLCLAVWKNASNLLFLVFGQNHKIGEFLERKVNEFLSRKGGVRSTQTISMGQLIFKYGFDIICVNTTKEEVKKKQKQFSSIPDNRFLSLDEYGKKYKVNARKMPTNDKNEK
ncbi:MAG: hypothetical protein J5656_02790 [Clostridia bacterium]|nr:hypothetical protein [Clostridia bacterium]